MGQHVSTAKQGLYLGHCGEAEHASKNFPKSYPHPHVGFVRLSKKPQGQKHVGRWVPQPHSMEARKHGTGQSSASPFQSGVSWSSRGAFPSASPPGGPGERRAWGEAMHNMPIAVLAGTLLLAPASFTLSAARAPVCKAGICHGAPGGLESFCVAPRCL